MSLLRSRPFISGLLIALAGLTLAAGGCWLVALGGSWYYLVAGLAWLGSGALLMAARRSGVYLYWLTLAGTVIWSLWEVGADGWALMPRLMLPAIVALWLSMPWTLGRLERIAGTEARAIRRRCTVSGCASLSIVAAVLICGWRTSAARYVIAGASAAPDSAGSVDAQDQDWRYYGRTPAGRRYSPDTQITPSNVSRLREAWSLRTGDLPRPGESSNDREFSFEATPIKVGDTLFFCTPHRQVMAVDAITGHVNWRYDPHPDTSANVYLACRGVAYFEAPPGTDCPRRIVTTTADAEEHLIELDADTGQLCRSFGEQGRVSLTAHLGPSPPGFHFISSQPLVLNNRIMLGGWIYDNQSEGEPSGVIRAFDPVSGALAWAWDMGRPHPTAPLEAGESWTRGTPNGWGTYTADPALNLVYIPLGNATPDYYGAHRRPFDEQYSSSIVALDITTGQERWHFQTVHHDLWDFDLPIGPSLIDLPGDTPGAAPVPALVQTTKQGQLFLLDRRTGKPLARVEERPVVPGSVPGEHYSPTQPYSVGMPSLTPAALTEADTWGVSPLDQLQCRIEFRRMEYHGLFTAPSLKGNIGYPAFDGVVDWYGGSIDPTRRVLILNSSYIPFTFKMLPEQEAIEKKLIKPWAGWGSPYPEPRFDNGPQYGTPYAVVVKPWLSALQVPCNRPAWGKLTAIDLVRRKVLWQRPLGTSRDTGPLGLRLPIALPTGTFSMGGNIITASGVIFIGATTDQYLRAFDEQTGRQLWQARLPAGGQATPITYEASDHRQYVVISVGGHGGLRTKNADYIKAYVLPAP